MAPGTEHTGPWAQEMLLVLMELGETLPTRVLPTDGLDRLTPGKEVTAQYEQGIYLLHSTHTGATATTQISGKQVL